jgi:hypothetical protein
MAAVHVEASGLGYLVLGQAEWIASFAPFSFRISPHTPSSFVYRPPKQGQLIGTAYTFTTVLLKKFRFILQHGISSEIKMNKSYVEGCSEGVRYKVVAFNRMMRLVTSSPSME